MDSETEDPGQHKPRTSAPAVLLLGDAGRGKTFSLATLAREVDKFFYVFTDPGGDESLIDGCRHYGVPLSKVHWRYIPPASHGWDIMNDLVKKVNTFDYKGLSNLSGIEKNKHRQFYDVLSALSNFTCERTGETFGPVDEFPVNYGVAFDSISGLNTIARETTVGAKPTMHEGEWGIAMEMEEKLLRKFVADVRCPRVMVGHLDKTQDLVSGTMVLSLAVLGRKLAPKIPTLFSDVIHGYTSGTDFYWSNIDDRIALKSRNLPLGQKHKPDFGPIMESWRRRQKEAEEATFNGSGEL